MIRYSEKLDNKSFYFIAIATDDSKYSTDNDYTIFEGELGGIVKLTMHERPDQTLLLKWKM